MTMPMRPGPDKADCACGCGLFGRPRRGKLEGHVRLCPCKRCQGGRNRTAGLRKQAAAAKSLGVPKVGPMRPGNEEHWRGALRVESKSGGIVRPVVTAYRNAEAQSEYHRPIGDHRPFMLAATHDGVALGIFRLDQAANIAAALAENLGLLVPEGDVVPQERERGPQDTPLVEAEPRLPGQVEGGEDGVGHE